MFAVGMLRGKTGVHHFELPMPRIKESDEVLVRVKEVGLDGTDFNMLRYNLQDIAEGRNEMAMGHEMTGVVAEVGKGVKTLSPGDAVVVTVRRGCGICHPCRHNQSDMCQTGLYTERGIHKQDGYPWGKDVGDGTSFPLAEKSATRVLSLPMYPELTQEELDLTVEAILEWDRAQKG